MLSPRWMRMGLVAAFALGPAAVAACGLGVQGLEAVGREGGAPSLDGTTGADAVGTGGEEPEGSDAGEGTVTDAQAGDADADAAGDVATDGADAADASDGSPADGATDADATTDAAPGCDGAVEDCTNGVDDDCNGLVDCQDPACASQGFACAPAVPAGWTLVAYAENAQPPCPTGWGSSAPFVEGPDGGGTCACTCGAPLANPCTQGTLSLSMGDLACACLNAQNVPLVSDGGCDPIGKTIGPPCLLSSWKDGKVAPLAPAAVACDQTTVLPPVTYVAQGETCAPQVPAGAGCAAGGECLPQTAPADACIEQAGVQACPPGFAQQHVVYAPSDVVDARQCGSCGCQSAATSCTGATVTLYDDPLCSQGAVTLGANGSCNGYVDGGDPSSAQYFTYQATPNTGACSGAATAPLDAGLALSHPVTLCCP